MKTTAVAALAALAFFTAGNILLPANAALVEGYFYSARMVGLAHVFTLGWMSLMIAGVLRQLAPFGFKAEIRRQRLAGAALAFWIPGILLMIIGFWRSAFVLAGMGTIAVAAGVALFLAVYLPVFVRREWDIAGIHVLVSLVSLGLAAGLGVWLGLAKAWDIALPAPFASVLFAHIHLAGAGWGGGMILGVMARLFPQPHLEHPRAARLRLSGFVAGLAGLVAALLAGLPHVLPGTLLGISMIGYSAAYVPVLWRFRRPGDRSTFFLIAAWISMGATGVIGFALAGGAHLHWPEGLRLQLLYGYLYIIGGLTLMILGMLYRIIPTHVSKLLARRGIAGAQAREAMIAVRTQTVALTLLVAGLGLASAAIVAADPTLFAWGAMLWLLGIIGYLSGIVRLAVYVARVLSGTTGAFAISPARQS